MHTICTKSMHRQGSRCWSCCVLAVLEFALPAVQRTNGSSNLIFVDIFSDLIGTLSLLVRTPSGGFLQSCMTRQRLRFKKSSLGTLLCGGISGQIYCY